MNALSARFQPLHDPGYIATLFDRLIRRHVLVSLFFEGDPTRYISTIMSLEGDNATVLLDTPYPSAAQAKIAPGGRIQLEARVDGTALRCALNVRQLVDQQGMMLIRTELPASVDYAQRRQGHRVRIDTLAVPAEIYAADGMAYKGVIYDIATAGVSLVLEDIRPFLNTEVYRCTLYPHGEPSFHSRIEICCRRHDAALGRYILGGSFVELDRRLEHNLNRLVTEMERQLLRSRRLPANSPENKA